MKFIFTCLLIFISSCSKQNKSGTQASVAVTPHPEIEELEIDTEKGPFIYLAQLNPINEAITGKAIGGATIALEGDELVSDVRFSGTSITSSIMHIQNIYSADRCPNQSDDTNNDGIIDIQEAQKIMGKILVPLDDDLNSQHIGLGTSPAADEFGGYVYSRSASFKRFLEDLKEPDIFPEGSFTKLSSGQKLNFLKHPVLIQGVAETISLPPTVAGSPRISLAASLPVSCGILELVTQTPGSENTEVAEVPVAIPGVTYGDGGGIDDGADSIIHSPDPEGPGDDYGD